MKKKKKKPRERTTLSFAMDDGEEESAAEAVPKMPKKKNKLNPSIGASHALRTEVAPAAAPAAPAPPAPPSPPATLPAGHSCVRHVGEREGAVEVSIEAMASMSSARTKITGMASHGVSMTIQVQRIAAKGEVATDPKWCPFGPLGRVPWEGLAAAPGLGVAGLGLGVRGWG